MRMTQQQCKDSLKGMAIFLWWYIKLCFYTSGPASLILGIMLLTQGKNTTVAYLMIIYGVAVTILFLVNMIRKQRYLLLLILAVLVIPAGTVVRVLAAAAVIGVFVALYCGVVAKEKKKTVPLNRFDRWIKSVVDRYIYILLDIYVIRRWLITKPYFAEMITKKCCR